MESWNGVNTKGKNIISMTIRSDLKDKFVAKIES